MAAACLLLTAALNSVSVAGDVSDSGLGAGIPAILRWGGDQEGGGPYIYPLDDNPEKVVGFEVDLAEALARRMSTRARFVQSDWDLLLQVLDLGNIDLAINGYEYSAVRAARYRASIPYYIYELGLCAPRKKSSISSWESLREVKPGGEKKRVGVLEGSAADRYVSDKYGGACQVVRYKGSTETLWLVQQGQLDATVQDLPVLQFYLERKGEYPGLAIVDRPAAPGYYVLYSRPEDGELISEVNRALRELWDRGELKAIYERYGIWNATQEQLPEVWASWNSDVQPGEGSRWLNLARQVPLLIRAAGVTVALAAVSMPLAILIGVVVALVRSWGTPALGGSPESATPAGRLLRLPFTAYVELIRGTPLVFQLFVVYFLLPQVLKIRIDEFWSGVAALAINYSAYESEIFRLGLMAIPRGQMEAALSLGMSRPLAVRRIILPQAVRIVIPATANDFIALFKDTAVCSVIAVEELSKQYSMGAKSTGMFLEMAALASVLYLLMSYPLSLAAGWLERRLRA